MDGAIYGMPFDTWAPLWHINLNYFRKAGLVRGRQARSCRRRPEELLAQARQFKAATGKPYLVQALANRSAGVHAQSVHVSHAAERETSSPTRSDIKLQTPEARRVVELFKTIYDEDLTTKNQDYAAATRGFINGDGGVYLVGTWMIGDYDAESQQAGPARCIERLHRLSLSAAVSRARRAHSSTAMRG